MTFPDRSKLPAGPLVVAKLAVDTEEDSSFPDDIGTSSFSRFFSVELILSSTTLYTSCSRFNKCSVVCHHCQNHRQQRSCSQSQVSNSKLFVECRTGGCCFIFNGSLVAVNVNSAHETTVLLLLC